MALLQSVIGWCKRELVVPGPPWRDLAAVELATLN